MDIATGRPEDHPTPLPLNESLSPGVAPETPIVPGQLHGPTVDARDTTGEYQAQLSADVATAAAAQASGQDARNTMLGHYQAQALPLGGQIGDPVTIPEVPANTVPSETSDLYPYPGQEPTPAGVGFYHGNSPNLPG